MKTLILALIAAFALFAGGTATAAKPAPSGTIALAAGSQTYLGGTVTFDYTANHIRGTSTGPRIEVDCYQPVPFDYTDSNGVTHTQTDPLVYGEAGPANQSFMLGGAASVWLFHGGPADCTATLYYWDFHPVQTFNPLASVSFTAGG